MPMMSLDETTTPSHLQAALADFLANYVSQGKLQGIERVLAQRTRHLTVVLENIYHPHNASAVVRTCDCFGIQDLHVIQSEKDYNINPKVVHGAGKWVDIYRYGQKDSTLNATKACFDHLRANGYKILATSPKQNSLSIDQIEVRQKTAIAFGTELSGLGDYAIAHADGLVHVPMYGFTESLNISVCAAICLQRLVAKMQADESLEWRLSQQEKTKIRLAWYKKVIRNAHILEKEFIRSQNRQ